MFHPAPKPDPRRKKAPKPIRANTKRKYDTFSRCYESEDRVEWVGRLPCVVSRCPSKHQDNAHITIDGARRKACGADLYNYAINAVLALFPPEERTHE